MSTEKPNNFWTTLNLLVGVEWKKNVQETVEEWLQKVEIRKNASMADSVKSGHSENGSNSSENKTKYRNKKKVIIQLPKVECSFNHPVIRSRLERLMGSNLVQLTDRIYMRRLHERILEDYVQVMEKRIADREAREREREKKLVLTGQIPFDQAPKEMANHPVLLINAYCEKLIAERRAKIKVPQVHIPLYLYIDDTPDSPCFLSIADGHFFRKAEDRVCVPPETHLQFTDEEDIEKGYMFTPEDFLAIRKYESPLIQELDDVETVEEMYNLADDIIGPLKYIKDTTKVES